MKTVISNKTREALEVAKHILYSLKVVAIGLFIPSLFIFGVTYNSPKKPSVDRINICNLKQVVNDNVTVDFNKPLSDQNS